MLDSVLLLILFISLVLLYQFYEVQKRKNQSKRDTQHTLPAALQGARLILCEPKHNLAIKQPFALHGRPDEVYELRGVMYPVDTKTRNNGRVYNADILKLSCYGLLLRGTARFSKYKLSEIGYIRLVNRKTGQIEFKKVSLMPSAQIEHVNNRRLSLIAGVSQCQSSSNPALCRGCYLRPNCPRPHPKA
jgi:hypothetical protein